MCMMWYVVYQVMRFNNYILKYFFNYNLYSYCFYIEKANENTEGFQKIKN